LTLNSRTLTWLALGASAYAVIEITEAVGLWLLKRWGEYFAMIATSVGIPYEIYDLTAKVTVLRLVAFVINVALVVYLVVTKRLFGVRGGKKAYEARLRSASILQAEIDALAAAPAAAAAPGRPGPARRAGGATRGSEVSETTTSAGPGQPDEAKVAGRPGPPTAGDRPSPTMEGGQPTDAAATSSSAAE
jgi:Predicted membrane protein (DUF2127)